MHKEQVTQDKVLQMLLEKLENEANKKGLTVDVALAAAVHFIRNSREYNEDLTTGTIRLTRPCDKFKGSCLVTRLLNEFDLDLEE